MMSSIETLEIDKILDCVWRAVCKEYDICAARPEMSGLLEEADLGAPRDAACTVLLNILSEVPDHIGRFSPWYKLPARAFGLINLRDPTNGRVRWILAPEAECQWADELKMLEESIRQSVSLLLATEVVNALMSDIEEKAGSGIAACCDCEPLHIIIVNPYALFGQGIICNTCHQPYRPLTNSPKDFWME